MIKVLISKDFENVKTGDTIIVGQVQYSFNATAAAEINRWIELIRNAKTDGLKSGAWDKITFTTVNCLQLNVVSKSKQVFVESISAATILRALGIVAMPADVL
jgi:nicotinamide riboside kinase